MDLPHDLIRRVYYVGMLIKQLYEQFEIMPQLVEHQLRVGAVGQIVAENWIGKCDVELVTMVCLLHDMGNIVKFDLSDEAQKVSKFGKIENLSYWQKVQQKYWDKYGRDAHAATKGILVEAGLAKYIKHIEEENGLYNSEASEEQLVSATVPAVVLMYADMRVIPQGVVSYRERVDDLRERYGGGKTPTWYGWTQAFEKWLQSQIKIDPSLINEEQARARFDSLLSATI